MILNDEVKEYFLIAAKEFSEPEVNFTSEFLKSESIETENNVPVCHRYVKGDNSYSFYFKIRNRNSYYRVLVLKDEKFVWSCQVICGNAGYIEIKNFHNPRSTDVWLGYFNREKLIKYDTNDHGARITVNDNLSYGIDEIIEQVSELIDKSKAERFQDDAMQNEVTLIIDRYVFGNYDSELEIEKWNINDLSKYMLNLKINLINE